jgi:arginase
MTLHLSRRALCTSIFFAGLAACTGRGREPAPAEANREPARAEAPPARAAGATPAPARRRAIDLIDAPSNLGLRPLRPGVEPGAWRAPEALERAGLSARLRPERRVSLPRPTYRVSAQPGTRIRNGVSLREFNLALSAEVARSLERGALPVVVGGDCSVLLGALHGLRRAGGRGLVHVDGHADFFHPGNYDAATRLGSAAGMDLALATGRGEPILTEWPGLSGPLAADADVVQLGERDSAHPQYAYPDFKQTAIERIAVEVVKAGMAAAIDRVLARLAERGIERAWLHIDLDVLDQSVMPAVDSTGSPGLTYAELSQLVGALVDSGRIAGLGIAIYDPDLDPDGRYAAGIVDSIASALADRRSADIDPPRAGR